MPRITDLRTPRPVMLEPYISINFQLEQNKIIRDAKVENTKVKRAKRLLKAKVSKILNECLPLLQKEHWKKDEKLAKKQ
jgi:hypothetical protein